MSPTTHSVSVSPTTYSVSDSIVTFTPAPTPHSRWSLSDTHKFIGFFFNRTTHKFIGFFHNRTSLQTSYVRPTTYSVSDIIVTFTPAPTPHSRWSISYTHKFMGFFFKRTTLQTASVSPTTHSVSDNIVTFKLSSTPHSHWSLSPTHSIHTPTLSTPTLLTFTCTQVLRFLPRLTRSRTSGVTTRPDTRLTVIPTDTTQCKGGI